MTFSPQRLSGAGRPRAEQTFRAEPAPARGRPPADAPLGTARSLPPLEGPQRERLGRAGIERGLVPRPDMICGSPMVGGIVTLPAGGVWGWGEESTWLCHRAGGPRCWDHMSRTPQLSLSHFSSVRNPWRPLPPLGSPSCPLSGVPSGPLAPPPRSRAVSASVERAEGRPAGADSVPPWRGLAPSSLGSPRGPCVGTLCPGAGPGRFGPLWLGAVGLHEPPAEPASEGVAGEGSLQLGLHAV